MIACAVIQATPPLPRLSLNLEPYSQVHQPLKNYDSSSDSDEVPSPLVVSVEKPGSLARYSPDSAPSTPSSSPHCRRDWEKFQSKVSKQLLARYFYSCEQCSFRFTLHV